jgi:hypothetical protein
MRRRHARLRLPTKSRRRRVRRFRFSPRRLLCLRKYRFRAYARVHYGRLPRLRTGLKQQIPVQKTKRYAALFALRARTLSSDFERTRGLAEGFSYRTLSAALRPTRCSFGKQIGRMLTLKLKLAPRALRRKVHPLAIDWRCNAVQNPRVIRDPRRYQPKRRSLR